MKVLLVNGSPHKEGCTFTALSEVARTLEEKLGFSGSETISQAAAYHAENAQNWGNAFLTTALISAVKRHTKQTASSLEVRFIMLPWQET